MSCVQLALPYLRRNQGNIINVSSLVGTIGQRHAVPYVATKVNLIQRWSKKKVTFLKLKNVIILSFLALYMVLPLLVSLITKLPHQI